MASSKAEGIQGTTPRAIPIESFFLTNTKFLNSTLNEISELRQPHGALEAWVISMQQHGPEP